MNRSTLFAATTIALAFTLAAAAAIVALRLVPASPAPVVHVGGTPPPDQPPGSFTVTGTATLAAVPDVAELSIRLQAEAPRSVAAAKAVRDRQAKLVEGLASLGIGTADLKVSTLELAPLWNDEGRVRGYYAAITILATTKDFDLLAPMMEHAADAGATSMSSRFRVSDLVAVKTQLRDQALAAARAKAEQMTKALGVAPGAVIAIVEDAGAAQWTGEGPWANEYTFRAAKTYAALEAEASELSLTISVTYRLS